MVPVVRTLAVGAIQGAILLAAPHGIAATGDLSGGGSGEQPAPDGPPNGGAPLSGTQLTQQYAALSPEVHDAITNLIKSKGVDALSNMSEGDARSTFESLPADVKAQLQAKWDGLSDAQRTALKALGPNAIKQMLASQMSAMVKQTMAPVMKPMQDAVDGTRTLVEKARDFMHRSREMVQGWIGRLTGGNDRTAGQPEP